jgi:hypothetical protein
MAIACTRGQEGVKGTVFIATLDIKALDVARPFSSLISLSQVDCTLRKVEQKGLTRFVSLPQALCTPSVLHSILVHCATVWSSNVHKGTCQKGLLANLADKTGAFGQPWDEIFPCAACCS